jgi:hypothetical protein
VWRAAITATFSDRASACCALAGLVDATVEPRWAQIADFYDPNLLANAMLAACRALLLDGGTPPATDGFAAGRFYLRRVYDELRAADDATAPHPLTQTWHDDLGIDLPDIPAAGQRAWLEQTSRFTYSAHERLVAGTARSTASGNTSRLEDLARPLARDATGNEGLVGATRRTTPDHEAWVERLSTEPAVTG